MSAYMQLILFAILLGFSEATSPVYLESYLQPEGEVDRKTYEHPDNGSRICSRECVEGEVPKICYYKMKAESYTSMSDACGNCPTNMTDCYNDQCITAGGKEKEGLFINRRYPGQSIEGCLGDRFIIDVENVMPGRTTAIHWHGVFQQGSQFMDGVPMLTQCSIHEGTTFRYDFMANNEGTHFWHSHDGLQKLDGLEGNLVIRIPKTLEPNGNLYDHDYPEHKVFVSDWTKLTADQMFPGLHGANAGQDANNLLINGKGRTVIGSQSTLTPYAVFYVQAGKRYRFRIIGGLCTVCPSKFSIQGHTMLVIATDGNPVAPTRVDSINLFSGERYDVVVEASQTPGPFWIHVKGLGTCVAGKVYQLGVLQYENAPSSVLSPDPGYEGFEIGSRILNPENGTCDMGSGGVCPTQLVNSNPVPKEILNSLPDYNFYLKFGFMILDSKEFFVPNKMGRFLVAPDLDLLSSEMNNISFVAPSSPPLTQPGDVAPGAYCPINADGVAACPSNQPYCECVHVIEVPLGSKVQIFLSDESPRSDLNHPFHLHGYAFYLMQMGQPEPGETNMDIFKKTKTTVLSQSPAPVQKDTTIVPSGGYAIIKFIANNPGFWFFHCHFEYHLATGMAAVVKVGQNTDMPAPPPNFPKCGDFKNTVYS